MNLTIVFAVVAILQCASSDKKILSDWETKKRSDAIKLQYRWVLIGDTLETRQTRAILHITAPEKEIIEHLKDGHKLKKWMAGSKKCEVYPISDNEWVTYTLFNIPKPFPQKDLITKYTVHGQRGKTEIKITSAPGFLPKNNGISRLEHYEGAWTFTPVSTHTMKVVFSTTTFSKPVLPRFIQDPIIQRVLMQSFENLKNLSENL